MPPFVSPMLKNGNPLPKDKKDYATVASTMPTGKDENMSFPSSKQSHDPMTIPTSFELFSKQKIDSTKTITVTEQGHSDSSSSSAASTPEKEKSSSRRSSFFKANAGIQSQDLDRSPTSTTGSYFEEFKYDTTIEAKTTTTVVKDVTTHVMVECRKHLSSKADDILRGTPTCYALMQFIAAERLRSMPQKGSTWDNVLKWAENFAKKIEAYTYTVGGFVVYGFEGSKVIYGCCRALLQKGVKRIALLEKVFSILYQMGICLGFFLQQKHHFSSSAEIQTILAEAFSDLISLTFAITIRYKKDATVDLSHFDDLFGSIVDSFYSRKESFISEVWSCALQEYMASAKTTVKIHTIWEWLSFQDRTLETFLSDRLGSRVTRYEYTCEWFEPTLRDFQRGTASLLWITGASGCGKSVLAGWILDRLRRTSHLRHGYDAVSFAISPYLKTQQTTLAVVKGLLLQLLERSVGDLTLYKALAALYERTEMAGVTDNLEGALWKALDESLKRVGRVIFVVDGLEQLQGGTDAAQQLAKHLHGFATRHRELKVILFSRPMKLSFACDTLSIEEKLNAADVRRFIEVKIAKTHEFRSLKEGERATIVQKLAESSKSTFVWAKYAIELLKLEKTVQGMLTCIDALPRDLPQLIHRLCRRLDFKSADTRLIISFLIAAERPLSVTEMKALLEIDVRSSSRSPRLTSAEDDISAACGSLVSTRDGLVCFSHSSIREYLLRLCMSDDSFPLTVEDAHRDIAIRSLAYLKSVLKSYETEPDIAVSYDARTITHNNPFVEYATRYWISHFKSSSLYRKGGKHVLTDEFRICFPDTTVLALIEGSWWEAQTCASDAFEMHSLALELRRTCLGEKHKAVVQCYFNLGKIFPSKASSCNYYYTAWELLDSIDENSGITRKCALKYLDMTEKTVTTKTETIAKRIETVTRYIYVSSKRTHGEYHEETIKWGKQLADILVSMKKLEESLVTLREVRKACVRVYGELHKETMSTTSTLTGILKKVSQSTSQTTTTTTTTAANEIETITASILEVCEKNMKAWEDERIAATFRMAKIYESKKETKKSEELIRSLYNHNVEACKDDNCTDAMLEAKIKVTLHYCRFLKRQSRDKEAEKMLIGLWKEYKNMLESKDCDHESGLLIQIRAIGEELSKWDVTSVAESIFSTLYHLYKNKGKTTTNEGSVIAMLLAKMRRGSSDPSSEEAILKELFEAAITSSSATITTIVGATLKLTSFYQREEKWTKAIEVCRKALVRVWASISDLKTVPKDGDCVLPRDHHHESIDLATQMAVCYRHKGLVQKAEWMYLYILFACRSSLDLRDTLVMQANEALVEFYTTIGKTDQAIERYDRLFDECKEMLGMSHEVTMKLAYKIAIYCKKHAPRKSEQYYLEIANCIYRHPELASADTIDSIFSLCLIYERDGKPQEASRYYKQLWDLFCLRGRDCGMKEESVLDLYHKFIKLQTQKDDVYNLTVQFREACIKHYGVNHLITIKVTIELAMIMEQMEAHREQAIQTYEDICAIIDKHAELRVLFSETIVHDIKKRLATLFASNSTSASKAEIIYYDSWENTKKRHGWAHEESLSRLHELIMFFKAQGNTESIETAKSTISTAIIEILTKEKDTQRLYSSGVALAKLYLDLGLKDLAWEYIKEVRTQLTSEEVKTSQKFGFSLRKSHTIDRRLLIFVIAFERCLNGAITENSYNEIIHDFLAESSLFESWVRTLQYGGTFETSIAVGSQLRQFLLNQERHEESEKITEELWRLFLSAVGENADKNSLIYQLFLVCVSEMASQETEISVLDAGVTAVINHYQRSDFPGAYELGTWVFKYVKKQGGFTDHHDIFAGFRLAICMAGTASPKCNDSGLTSKMMTLSKEVLTEIFKASESETISFASMDLTMANSIVTILGDQKDYKSMERVLRSLWASRSAQPHWGPDVIVSIGTTLAQCLFAANKRDEAIGLTADIAYNLHRVWSDLDPSTVRAFNLLSGFYTNEGQYTKAMRVHTEVIRRGLDDDEEDNIADYEPKLIITQQMRLLKRAFERNGGKWESEEARTMAAALWEEANRWYDEFGVERVEKWKKSDKGQSGTEDIGKWTEPANWGFLERGTHAWEDIHANGHFIARDEDDEQKWM